MGSTLAKRNCVPCRGDTSPMKGKELICFMAGLSRGWTLIEDQRIEKEFHFKDFREALNFTNDVGKIAEAENHHPEIGLGWGRVVITLSTHKVHGLTENDFILAAKIDALAP
jgi:4a-hydroxytetrahydrobiopterin dehydratase